MRGLNARLEKLERSISPIESSKSYFYYAGIDEPIPEELFDMMQGTANPLIRSQTVIRPCDRIFRFDPARRGL